MDLQTRLGDDVSNLRFTKREQGIGNQGAMAAPRNSLGAHESHSLCRSELHHLRQRFLKLDRLHVIGKAPEAGIAPCGVHGVFAGFSQPTEQLQMAVLDSLNLKGVFQVLGIEVRHVPGSRYSSHIEEQFNSVMLKKFLKLIERAGGVANGVDQHSAKNELLS